MAKKKDDAPIPELGNETLVGDLVAWVRDEMIALPSVWQSISEEGQKMVLDRLAARASAIARQVIEHLASDDMPALTAELESLTFKDGIKAVLQLSAVDANRYRLADAVGGYVRVVIVPSVEASHGGGIPKAEADQRALDLERERAEDAMA